MRVEYFEEKVDDYDDISSTSSELLVRVHSALQKEETFMDDRYTKKENVSLYSYKLIRVHVYVEEFDLEAFLISTGTGQWFSNTEWVWLYVEFQTPKDSNLVVLLPNEMPSQMGTLNFNCRHESAITFRSKSKVLKLPNLESLFLWTTFANTNDIRFVCDELQFLLGTVSACKNVDAPKVESLVLCSRGLAKNDRALSMEVFDYFPKLQRIECHTIKDFRLSQNCAAIDGVLLVIILDNSKQYHFDMRKENVEKRDEARDRFLHFLSEHLAFEEEK
jgi:hypothetical protein